jgi:hypothetical protein
MDCVDQVRALLGLCGGRSCILSNWQCTVPQNLTLNCRVRVVRCMLLQLSINSSSDTIARARAHVSAGRPAARGARTHAADPNPNLPYPSLCRPTGAPRRYISFVYYGFSMIVHAEYQGREIASCVDPGLLSNPGASSVQARPRAPPPRQAACPGPPQAPAAPSHRPACHRTRLLGGLLPASLPNRLGRAEAGSRCR